MIVLYNDDADLKVSDTYVRNSLLSIQIVMKAANSTRLFEIVADYRTGYAGTVMCCEKMTMIG